MQSMKFTLEKAITLKIPYRILMCQRAVRGDGDRCPYAVFESCHAKRKSKGHQKLTSTEESKMRCHHEFHNLVDSMIFGGAKRKRLMA